MLLPRVDGPLGPIAYMWILGFFVDGNENQGENNSRNRISMTGMLCSNRAADCFSARLLETTVCCDNIQVLVTSQLASTR